MSDNMEKDKRDAGLLYNAGSDLQLLAEVKRAKGLCHRYNQLEPMDFDAQKEILRELLGKVGERCVIYPPLWCDYGYNIEIGEDFIANHGFTVLDGAKVVFGDHVFVGPGCGFHTAAHPIDAELRNAWLVQNKPIHVGNNVGIGAGVQVMPGVTIGDGCVIGAGSVVTHDIPEGSVAAGNPCRVIRKVSESRKALVIK